MSFFAWLEFGVRWEKIKKAHDFGALSIFKIVPTFTTITSFENVENIIEYAKNGYQINIFC